MKRFFLVLSLLMATSIQTKEDEVTNIQKFEKKFAGEDQNNSKQSIDAAIIAVAKSKSKPPLLPKPSHLKSKPPVPIKPSHLSGETRNVTIFLNKDIVDPFDEDAIITDVLESLLIPSNYTIFLSSTLIQGLVGKYHLLQDLINKNIDSKDIEKKYQIDTPENRLGIASLKQHFEEKRYSLEANDLPEINNLVNELEVLHNCIDRIFSLWAIYKTKHNFFVLVPKDQQQFSHFSKDTSYKSETLSNFIKKSHLENISSFSDEQFLTDFRELIKGTGEKSISRPLNVVLTGHGLNESGERMMAGLTMKSFKKFIHFLETTNTHSLLYSTCYGGGQNSVDTFDMELPYIVIAQGVAETSVNGTYMTFKHLPSYFKYINTDLHKAFSSMKNIYANDPQEKLMLNDYKIRLPKTNWFTLAQINTKLQTIGEIKSVAASLNKKPIVLSGQPCGLLTTTLPILELPSGNQLPLFMGIAPSQGDAFYAFHTVTIEKEYDTIEKIIEALHVMFEKSDIGHRFYENAFYIKSLIIGERTFQNVILYKNTIFIQYTAGEEKIVQADRKEIEADSFIPKFLTKEEASQTIFHKAVRKGQKQLKKYWKKIEQSNSVASRKPHSVVSDFAELRQDLIEMKPEELTEDIIQDLKEEFNEANLSDIEKTVLESTLEAQKAL